MSGARGGWVPKVQPTHWNTFDPTDDEERLIPELPYVVRPYLPRGVVTGLVGPGGAGKSLLLLMWAVAIALGIAFDDFDPRAALRVMVINMEDDIDEMRRRIAAALRFLNRAHKDLGHRLYIATTAQFGRLFTLDEDTREIKPTEAYDELLAEINDFGPDAIFVDPLIEVHDQHENDNKAMHDVVAQFRFLARTRIISIVLAQHVHKGAKSPGDAEMGRGASATRCLPQGLHRAGNERRGS
jgi:RecA-family ATPase